MSAKPVFVFVMGGPGCGKGTTCERLAENKVTYTYRGKRVRFIHIGAGDLLRGIVAGTVSCDSSEIVEQVKSLVQKGKIVPSEIIFGLVKQALISHERSAGSGTQNIYLLDGFPRKRDQGDWLEGEFGRAHRVIYMDCPLGVLRKRLRKRQSQSTGAIRFDDLPSLIEKRISVHVAECLPVVESYRSENRLHSIDCDEKSIEEVTEATLYKILGMWRAKY
mmetsp:Transcript_24253/g.37809  ORF Transcript_24253/g.37809 Transcript_24253/m.37809 type:complete len:220 (-) Transcript_24253:5-664(-)